MVQNKRLIFKEVPQDIPIAGQHLTVEPRNFDLDQTPLAGGITIKNLYGSFDPYLRILMREPSEDSYSPPFRLGEAIESYVVAKVLTSNNDKFNPGDLITGVLPVQEYGTVDKARLDGVKKIENFYGLDLKHYVGALGMPGLTAYSSFYSICRPVRGETIFISAASGAVGQIVGQLARREGLTVIGSVGSDDKLDFIRNELEFYEGFNYKKEKSLNAFRRLAPGGIDIYYDNVGGEQLEASIEVMNSNGRIAICGMVSQYNLPDDQKYGIKNLFLLVSKSITLRGFLVGEKEIGPVYSKEHQENVARWLHEGTLKAKTSVTDGIDNAPSGFIDMLEGRNFGKAVLKIAELE